MNKFELNLWTAIQLVTTLIVIVSWFSESINNITTATAVILYFIARGFRNIERKMKIETNLFSIEWGDK